MTYFRSLWLFFLLMLFANTAFAEQFRFKHLSTSDGLLSNAIRSIAQDSHGFIWIGTDNSLARYDGREFKNFRHIPDDTTSLGSNYINVIIEDSRKTFWIGADNGVYIYYPETETFSRFDKTTDNHIGISESTTHIKEDSFGNIWFATEGQGAFFLNSKENKLYQYSHNPGKNLASLSSNFLLSLFIDTNGAVWASSNSAGRSLHLFNNELNDFCYFPISNAAPQFNIYAINEDSNGYLWLGSWENGLCKLDKEKATIREFASPENKYGISHIHSIYQYEPHILFASSDDGLLSLNTKTEEFNLMSSSELNPTSLSDKFIYPIFKDKEGGLWVGGYYKGLNYAAPKNNYIEGYLHSEYRNSVGGTVISSFCEDPEGNVWIGSDDGGLSYFNTKTKRFTNYMPSSDKNSLSYHNIHALRIYRDRLWIGTYSGGLNTYDLKTGQFRLYLSDINNSRTIDGNSIYSVFEDNKGELWIGSMQGLNKYHPETDDFTREFITGTTTVDIVQEKDNTLWFATWGDGLFKHSPETGEWVHYNKTLPHNMVFSLCIDRNERLWIATDNGLCYYDKETDSFIIEPLTCTSISISDLIDHAGFLWLCTANGFVRYSPETKETKVFTKSDGLQSDQFTIKGSMLSSDNKMYLGTIDGFNILDPRELATNDYVPPVAITNFQVHNKDLKIKDKKGMKKAVGFTDEIILTHRQNVLSIEYAALSYNSPLKNQYRYMLEGFDLEWNEVGNQQKAGYTNLPAGEYLFRVAGSNNDGVWNEKEATLRIRVLPPFWLSAWAYFFYAVIIVAAVSYSFYTYRKKVERKNRQRIKELQQEKEEELYKAKINFFTQVAHEIRTPVSLIIGPLEKIIDTSAEFSPGVKGDLNIINKNSQRLLSLVNQLLDFRKAEQGNYVPNITSQNIYHLLHNVYDRFNPLILKKEIDLELKVKNKELTALIDADAFTKITSNLLTNAIKYAKSEIKIELIEDHDHFHLLIVNDGDSINEKEFENIFKPFYQIAYQNKPGTGLGLSLVKLLTEAHHGTIDVKSIPGETSFTVTLPLKQVSISAQAQNSYAVMPEISDPLLDEDEIKVLSTSDEKKPTILIVEDNIDLCNFLHSNFISNYNTAIAHNGQEGLDVLQKQSIDLIISDIMMPVMDGINFCKEIKENLLYSHIPFILLTAKTESMIKLEGMKTGADAYIEKPFSIQLLNAQVENLLNSRKLLKKKFSEMPFVKLESIAGNKADELFLTKLNGIIDKNISNVDFSIDILAEQLHISRSGLFSKIKTLTDMTPNELIQLVRLKKAAELLATKDYRINEICYQVGFNNPSYFSKCFQKQFGVLPKDFTNK